MDHAIQNRMALLVERGNALLNGLQSELQALNAPRADLARSLLSEGAGEIALELLGSRRARGYGRELAHTLLRQEKNRSQQQILARYEVLYRNWLSEVIGLLRQVSMVRPKLVAPGNSNSLVSRVSKAESLKNLDARVRYVLRQLEYLRIQDLVWNSSLPKDVPKIRQSTKLS